MAVDCMDSSNYVSKMLSDRRKAKKPLMEKMRRARINDSLNELKVLVLELLNKDASRYSKMEKADVLEMTVGYLRAAQTSDKRIQDVNSLSEFRAGFNRCAAEVTGQISTSDVASTDCLLRESLLSHLASSCHGNVPSQTQSVAPSKFPANHAPAMWVPYPSPPPSPTNQAPMFLVSPIPVQRDITRPLSPVSPSCEVAPKSLFLESPVQKPVHKKTALWRPW